MTTESCGGKIMEQEMILWREAFLTYYQHALTNDSLREEQRRDRSGYFADDAAKRFREKFALQPHPAKQEEPPNYPHPFGSVWIKAITSNGQTIWV